MRDNIVPLFLFGACLLTGVESDSRTILEIYEQAEVFQENEEWEKAIAEYKLQLEKGGDLELTWSAKYSLATCYKQSGIWSEALYWYLEAFQTIATRPEPLLDIATHYRMIGENDLAYIFSKHGSRIYPYKNYEFEQELSIVSYYTRFKEDGYAAASHLLIRKDVPWEVKSQTYKNLLFYVQNLKNTRFQPIDIELPLIQEGSGERYHPMNPSIVKTKSGYKVICRAVNYTQIGAREFHTIDPMGFIRTKNYLVSYDSHFRLLSQQEILEDLVRERTATHILGMEDCRIFSFENRLWFTCTTRDTNPTATPQISLCELPSETSGELYVERLIPLEGPEPDRCEKNWLPFLQNNALHLIYSYDPFTVVKPDIETGECEIDLSYHPIHDFSPFKGSAGPIPFDNGYLLLIHETVHFPDNSRVYLHRLLFLDVHLYPKKISKPFTFLHQGIEFCNGMTLSHSGEDLVFAIGIEDSKAYFCSVDVKTVRSILTPLPAHL